MQKRVAVAFAVLGLIACAASADVGVFTSFTTTMTPMPGAFQFDVNVETTGAAPSSTDSMFVTYYFFNVDNSTAGWDNTFIHRDGTSNSFSGSFTVTGLIPNHQYKWAIQSDELWRGTTTGATWSSFWNLRSSFSSNYESPFFSSLISSASTIIVATGNGNGTIWWAENLMSGVAAVAQPNLLEVPTLDEIGLFVLGLSVLGLGIVALRRAG